VEKLVKIARGTSPIVLMAEFEVFVDLPSGRKGDRYVAEPRDDRRILEEITREEAYRVEEVCGDAAERLLEKHDYTTTAEVSMSAELVTREDTPASGIETQSTATIVASATATGEDTREGDRRRGHRHDGLSLLAGDERVSRPRSSRIWVSTRRRPRSSWRPSRSRATLSAATRRSPSPPTATDIDLRDLIDVARDSMSARIYNMAKRPDEDHMTYEAHADAKFVEDCVRALAEGTIEEFGHLSDDAVIHMKQSNDESIHQHNAHAEREVTMGDLRDELDAE